MTAPQHFSVKSYYGLFYVNDLLIYTDAFKDLFLFILKEDAIKQVLSSDIPDAPVSVAGELLLLDEFSGLEDECLLYSKEINSFLCMSRNPDEFSKQVRMMLEQRPLELCCNFRVCLTDGSVQNYSAIVNARSLQMLAIPDFEYDPIPYELIDSQSITFSYEKVQYSLECDDMMLTNKAIKQLEGIISGPMGMDYIIDKKC